MGPKRQQYRAWLYPSIGLALAMAVLDKIRVYIAHHQSTSTQYIVTRPIMDLCLAAEQRPVMQLSRRWWDQPPMYVLGIRAGRAAEEMGEKRGMEELEGESIGYVRTEGVIMK